MLWKIINEEDMARKYDQETSSKYTAFNQINNYFIGAISGFVIILAIPPHIFLFYPLYLIITIVLNIQDYRIRKRQLEKLLNNQKSIFNSPRFFFIDMVVEHYTVCVVDLMLDAH